LLILTCAPNISAQVQIELQPNQPAKEDKNSTSKTWQIPEATLPCSPEVKAWWDGVRAAAEAVQHSRGDQKDRKRFAQTLAEGATKSFNPPIPERKPFYLSITKPAYTEDGRRHRVTGIIMLRVEYRADGTIGEVTALNSLGYGLDEAAIAAARKTVFIPAVRNGVFVAFTAPMTMTFNMY
jgi:TonB family protein